MNSRILSALGLAALILASALAVSYAKAAGMLGEELGDRIVMVVLGLVIAASNNTVPKQLAPPRASAEAEAVAQAVRRVAGWAMTLGGLAWAGVWAFAPIELANPLAIAVMVTALVVVVGHGLWAWRRCRGLRSA